MHKKIVSLLIALVVVASGFSLVSAKTLPEINKIKSRTDASITLEILYLDYAKKDVDIKVRVKNKSTMKTEDLLFESKELDKNGKRNVKVEGLLPGTKYSFKIKVSKKDKNKYTSYSKSTSSKTKS